MTRNLGDFLRRAFVASHWNNPLSVRDGYRRRHRLLQRDAEPVFLWLTTRYCEVPSGDWRENRPFLRNIGCRLSRATAVSFLQAPHIGCRRLWGVWYFRELVTLRPLLSSASKAVTLSPYWRRTFRATPLAKG